ncbi:MAG: hypothetical protein AB1806_11840 [Acidobacteriota bacterium]
MSIFLVAVLGGALVVWWQKKTGRVTQAASRVVESSREAVGKTRVRLGKVALPRGRDRRRDGQFRDWIGKAELDRRAMIYKSLPADAADFTIWLQGLGDDELGTFVQDLSAFCDRRGFDLVWLMDPKITGQLKHRMEESVGLYCLSAWKSRDLQPFAIYRDWLADPQNKRNRVFAQRLFTRLVTVGLVTPSTDLLFAPEAERRAHAAKSMDAAAVQDPRTFASLLSETAAEVGATQAAGAKPAAPARFPL